MRGSRIERVRKKLRKKKEDRMKAARCLYASGVVRI
jgi:hypothetical protein